VVILVGEKLRLNLTVLMGNVGFRALLSRALALASTEVPWLHAMRVTHVAFATADSDTAKGISDTAGQTTEKRRSESYHLGTWGRGSHNYQEVRRAMLEPGDVRMLPYGEQLVFVTGTKPFRTKRFAITKSRCSKPARLIFVREALARAKRVVFQCPKSVSFMTGWTLRPCTRASIKFPLAQAAVTDNGNVNFTDFVDPVDQ